MDKSQDDAPRMIVVALDDEADPDALCSVISMLNGVVRARLEVEDGYAAIFKASSSYTTYAENCAYCIRESLDKLDENLKDLRQTIPRRG